jgi:hypothetical protein
MDFLPSLDGGVVVPVSLAGFPVSQYRLALARTDCQWASSLLEEEEKTPSYYDSLRRTTKQWIDVKQPAVVDDILVGRLW